MFTALSLALADAFAPEQRRAIVTSIALALLLLLSLWLAAAFALDHLRVAGIPWLDATLAVLGGLGALVLAWLLFPAMTMLVLGFFLDGVVAAVERRHYPDLPPARRVAVAKAVGSALRLFALAVVINVSILPLALLPAIYPFIYYGLNGYLLGREYFELVALRRLDGVAAGVMWRWHRGRLVLAGMVIAFLLSLPVFNLVAPVVAAAFMLHVFEGLRRRGG